MTFHCLLVVLSLCSALQDRPFAVMTGLHAATASWDWTVTRQGINRGGVEADPLARPFVHNNSTMVMAEFAEIVGTAWVANKAKHSRYRVIRNTWFVWQAAPIIAHIWGARTWRGFKGQQ